MVELVYTADLKSASFGYAGSTPALPTILSNINNIKGNKMTYDSTADTLKHIAKVNTNIMEIVVD